MRTPPRVARGCLTPADAAVFGFELAPPRWIPLSVASVAGDVDPLGGEPQVIDQTTERFVAATAGPDGKGGWLGPVALGTGASDHRDVHVLVCRG